MIGRASCTSLVLHRPFVVAFVSFMEKPAPPCISTAALSLCANYIEMYPLATPAGEYRSVPATFHCQEDSELKFNGLEVEETSCNAQDDRCQFVYSKCGCCAAGYELDAVCRLSENHGLKLQPRRTLRAVSNS
jgi:hypothetical protein